MTDTDRSDVPFRRRGSVRALAPLSVVAVVAAGAGLAPSLASAAPSLPPITAQALLVKVAQSKVDAYSGTVSLTANLGLPALPDLAGGANPLSLLTGTHTLQVAADGPRRQRTALLDTMSEYDLVHNGADLWIYDSSANTVQHATAPAHPAPGQRPEPAAPELTPQQAVQKLLAAVSPTTKVAVTGTESVAGQGAYTLTVTPSQAGSLIGRITVAVDAANGAPLRVAVYPAGSGTAAFELAFTSVSFSAPPASRFAFTPPKGATVEPLGAHGGQSDQGSAKAGTAGPEALGAGWLSVVELHGVDLNQLSHAAGTQADGAGPGANGPSRGDVSSYLNTLIGAGRRVSGAFGSGRLYTTDFLSLLVTDDNRLFAGAVTPSVLEADAAAQGAR